MGICLARDVTQTTICAKTFTTYITVTVAAPNFLVADVFGTGTSFIPCISLLLLFTLPKHVNFDLPELANTNLPCQIFVVSVSLL